MQEFLKNAQTSASAALSVVLLGFAFLGLGGEGNSVYGLTTIGLGSVQLFFSAS